jgi:hypothetical protein
VGSGEGEGEEDEGKVIRLMDFIYIYKIAHRNFLRVVLSRAGSGRDGGDNLTNAQCKPIQNCHN